MLCMHKCAGPNQARCKKEGTHPRCPNVASRGLPTCPPRPYLCSLHSARLGCRSTHAYRLWTSPMAERGLLPRQTVRPFVATKLSVTRPKPIEWLPAHVSRTVNDCLPPHRRMQTQSSMVTAMGLPVLPMDHLYRSFQHRHYSIKSGAYQQVADSVH